MWGSSRACMRSRRGGDAENCGPTGPVRSGLVRWYELPRCEERWALSGVACLVYGSFLKLRSSQDQRVAVLQVSSRSA